MTIYIVAAACLFIGFGLGIAYSRYRNYQPPPYQEAQKEFYRLHEERMEMVEVISQAEEALISLNRKATRDAMTGLTNRRAGEKILLNAHENALLSSILYSVLLVDIDHFKRVNDTHGHEIGDAAIKSVAAVLGNAIRGGDVACRWGGEEFLCILKGADISIATTIAERIRTAVELAEIPVAGKVTVSVGIATWCATIPDVAHVVKAADQGLYDAKQNGRNRVSLCDTIHLVPHLTGGDSSGNAL